MALNNIQEVVERSLFAALSANLVAEGYCPDITNSTRYPLDNTTNSLTPIGQANWEADIATIVTNMGFAIELFGTSAAKAKGLKKVPRIAIVPKRIMPGDLGYPPQDFFNIISAPGVTPVVYSKFQYPKESANMHFDIHLVSQTQAQSRVMNALIQLTLGQKVYIYLYNDPTQNFFIKQYNFYDTPDAKDGLEENIYQYEVQDLYLVNISTVTISPILSIGLDFVIGYKKGEKMNPSGEVDGDSDDAGTITITPNT